jgi:hypothetical protein
MTKQLNTASITAPAFYGLNTMDSEVLLDTKYARSAENCIIDSGGRIGARKGWQYVAQTDPVSTVNLKGLHRFVAIDGAEYFGAWSDTGFYIKNASTLDAVTYNGSNTLDAGNWQAATLNDAAFLFQRGKKPIYFSPTSGVLDDVENATNTASVAISNQRTITSITNGLLVTAENTTIVGITHSGTVATVNHAGHNFSTGDEVVIANVVETEYNGRFTITVVDSDSYTYTMSSSPSQDATGLPTATGVICKFTIYDHGLTTGDTVTITGANLSEYNGTFTVTVVNDNFFYVELASTPTANPSDQVTLHSAFAVAVQTNHGLSTGDTVTISGSTPTDYNGTYTVTVYTDDAFVYEMSTVPTVDAEGTLYSRTNQAVVTSVGHEVYTDDSVTITGATTTAYNGTFTVTKIDNNSYKYTLASVPTSDANGSPEAEWSKGTPPEANTVLSAYGRLWVANTLTNKTTIYWSDLLDGAEWRTDVGTVGSLDISSILVYGNDEIVALGAHNGYLIIFCKNNIIIMGDTDNQDQYVDPANMQLIEVIHNVGCIARDSIANTGTDIMFLSEAGVRSLGRTIQEKSQPMRDVSINVRDTLVDQVSRADKSLIRGVYSDHFAFYLLSIPDEKTVWCFDMRGTLENGGARVTRWNNLDHTSWLAFDGFMYMTNTKGLAEYKGFQDNGSKYIMQYYTNYFDFEMPNIIKIAKNVSATVVGSTGQKFIAKVGTDYNDIYTSYNLTVKDSEVAEYNIAEYNIGEYSGASLIENIRIPVGGSGFVVQLGFESTINGGFLNIQQVNLYVKQGRLN